MPRIEPGTSELNLTPRLTALPSPESATDGVRSPKIDWCGVTGSEAAAASPVPAAFFAATLNVYAVPSCSPVIRVCVVAASTSVEGCAVAPANGVTGEPTIALPPSSLGAVQPTIADVLSALAVTAVGAPGAPASVGVTAFEFVASPPEPPAFSACTVNVYAGGASRPVTVALVAGGDPLTVLGACAVVPAYGVITYDDGGPPDDGADHDTVADDWPAVAVTPDTAPGAAGSAKRTSTQ